MKAAEKCSAKGRQKSNIRGRRPLKYEYTQMSPETTIILRIGLYWYTRVSGG